MTNKLDEIVDFKQFFLKVIKNWYFFVISLLLTFLIAFGYNRYSVEYFNVETSILIKEENSLTTASDLLYERSAYQSKSLENKELTIKSYPLIHKTLRDLRFDICYFIEGNIKVTETYDAPITLKCHNTRLLKGKKIRIEIIDENSFILTDLSNNQEYKKDFNKKFVFNNVELIIQYNINFSFDESADFPVTIVKFQSLQSLTSLYQDMIGVEQKERGSTVINISMLAEDEKKGVVFLNRLVDNYIRNEIREKNLASSNTVKFINSQLIEMSDSLALIEQQIQEYKNSNKITDLSLKAQSIYTNIVGLETELAKTITMNNYYDYLSSYLSKGDNLEGVSVPTSFGVNDIGLNSLINKLVEIQIKKNILIDGGQVNNPAINQYNRQSKQLIINLQEAINTSKSANNLLLADYKRRIKKMEKSLSNIPQVEMELLNIERLQSISENIYVFLLKKRAEAKITSSSNVSDSKVLEPAVYFNKSPVSPDRNKVYMIAFLLGFLLPIIIIFIGELLNEKIITRIDLEKTTKIPLLGMISKNYSGYILLSKQSPKSSVYEGFRSLRSNLEFFNPSQEKKVYLVTSSISGEGKTYIAENLSIVFAKSGKKTLVVGADLRKPKLYSDFGFENKKGISNYILFNEPLSKVIFKSDIDNLDVLFAGPLPENPSDALLEDKFVDMMEKLKKKYDVIILDTPPVGLVADALALMKYSDINLYVTRQNYTKKGLLTYANDMYQAGRFGDIHIIFNDVKEGTGAYGYNYGYGYGYNYVNREDNNYFDNERIKS